MQGCEGCSSCRIASDEGASIRVVNSRRVGRKRSSLQHRWHERCSDMLNGQTSEDSRLTHRLCVEGVLAFPASRNQEGFHNNKSTTQSVSSWREMNSKFLAVEPSMV